MNPNAIIEKMITRDAFSQWLGITVIESDLGYCKIEMLTRNEMLNGFAILHGGITYSLADSALAFASNTHGNHAVSIETSISHLKPVGANEKLTATAKEQSKNKRIAIYSIEIRNSAKELIALFKGTVFRKETTWQP